MKNKIVNSLIFIVILILSALLIFQEQIGDLDELWQYSFANNIYNGLVPYKDFNMIVTPLFPFVASVFLRIFSNQLIVMRIFNTLVFVFILFITYKIFQLLKIDKIKSLFFVLILYFLFYLNLGVEYNYLILLITLTSLYFELRNIDKYEIFNHNKDIVLGILIGLTIVTKHTIGIALSVMFIFYKTIFIKNKQDYLAMKKIIIRRILGVMIPPVLLLIYLLFNNALHDCIDYCILGIMEFNNKVSYFNLFFNENIIINLFSFIMPVFLLSIIALLKYRKEDNVAKLLVMMIYAIVLFIGTFPIANDGHFIIYGFIGIMSTLYSIYIVMKRIIKNKNIRVFINTFIQSAVIIFLIIYILMKISVLLKFYKDNNICKEELNHYYGVIINKNLLEQIESVDSYILNKKEEKKRVYILDAGAVLYMLPIDIYNKNYDMFNKGNFGKNGENKLIEEISKTKDTQYLILKDEYSKNWQTPLKIIDYVKSNKSKIGEIEIFDIYE